MTIPHRGHTGLGTYFITSNCYLKKHLLQSDQMASLLAAVFYHYRSQHKYLLHEFVVMPNHLHLLITPLGETTLERAMQYIKGGFSYRVKKELGFRWSIWQTSYFDRRVRGRTEYSEFVEYIHHNPVKALLCSNPDLWPYSSASGKFELDPIPQRLKPSL